MNGVTVKAALVTAAFTLTGHAQAELVWSQEYEEYIDTDFPTQTICATRGEGSSELVWSDNYYAYVPQNHPRHVISAKTHEGARGVVWRDEYESYVPRSLATIDIDPAEGCPIS